MTSIAKHMILLAAILTPATGTIAQSWGDYTFYSQQNSTKAYLLNSSGGTYHSWTFASNKPTGYSAYLLEGGTVLRTISKNGNYFFGGGVCGELQKVDYNGNVLWDYVYSTTEYCSHHDLCPMPNGNVLLIAYESKTAAQVTQAGCSQSIVMWPDKIVEIQPSGTSGGTVVWEWHVWDHLCQNYNASKDNYVTSIVQHPELININYQTQKDWMHVNGLDYNEALDQITFSSHMLNEVYVIDHSTTTAQAAGHSGGNSGKGGDILYRWGNPAAYQASGTTIFKVVHDAHWVPADCPRANSLVAFNNKGATGNKSCVDFFYPPYTGYTYSITPGSAFAPSTYDLRYTYSGQATQDMGSSQQLPNGNTLITISQSGYIYETDSNMNTVWSKTVSGSVVNARRHTACYVNGTVAVTAAASPAQACAGTPVQLTASPSGGTSFTFSWTSDPPGFTSALQNPAVTPTVTTSYIVAMTNGNCTSYDTVTVPVFPVPETPVITRTGDSLVSSAAGGNQWFLNSSAIAGATGQYLAIGAGGSYQLQVTSADGCVSELSDPYLNVGSDEPASAAGWKVFPNPTTGMIYLRTEARAEESYRVWVRNSLGEVIASGENTTTFDLSVQPAGCYFLTLLPDKGKPVCTKIILNHAGIAP